MAVALDRRLVAVMFTDMAGYTSLLQGTSGSRRLTLPEALELALPPNPALA